MQTIHDRGTNSKQGPKSRPIDRESSARIQRNQDPGTDSQDSGSPCQDITNCAIALEEGNNCKMRTHY